MNAGTGFDVAREYGFTDIGRRAADGGEAVIRPDCVVARARADRINP
jgi:hypothetical protein